MDNHSTGSSWGEAIDFGLSLSELFYLANIFLQITKNGVDQFVPGKRVPSCQLYVKQNGQQEQSDELSYRIYLVGAKEPFNFFYIYPTASTPLPGTYISAICYHNLIWLHCTIS